MSESKYSYSEALALIENTMKWTHTRKYCTIVCKAGAVKNARITNA